jgi:hypothetical protein
VRGPLAQARVLLRGWTAAEGEELTPGPVQGRPHLVNDVAERSQL